MRYVFAMVMLVGCGGCTAASGVVPAPDAAAVDLAIATMAESPQPGPAPEKCARCGGTGRITHGDGHRTPCPDCQDGDGPYGGPIDTFRDAQELIRKGNDLADRGKTLLDAAQRDGKITVDVMLPKPSAPVTAAPQPSCPGGVCPVLPPDPAPPQSKTVAPSVSPSAGYRCEGSVRRPRLWRRFRR